MVFVTGQGRSPVMADSTKVLARSGQELDPFPAPYCLWQGKVLSRKGRDRRSSSTCPETSCGHADMRLSGVRAGVNPCQSSWAFGWALWQEFRQVHAKIDRNHYRRADYIASTYDAL
jgi:hypothetical protein